MPETAETHSQHLETNRNCTIEITNVSATYCLFKPKVHMESGHVYFPPQPTLGINKTEVFSLDKEDNKASGTVGVMTYDLFNTRTRTTDGTMAVMFSVPFDYNFYKNWLGVGIFPLGTECDKALFKSMYNDEEEVKNFRRHEADGSGIFFRGNLLEVRGCMSDGGKAIIKLELYDKMA